MCACMCVCVCERERQRERSLVDTLNKNETPIERERAAEKRLLLENADGYLREKGQKRGNPVCGGA